MISVGFKSSLPFVSTDSGICVDDNHLSPLFKHCINIKHPTMAFIGYLCVAAITQIVDMQVTIQRYSNTLVLSSITILCTI